MNTPQTAQNWQFQGNVLVRPTGEITEPNLKR